MMSKNEMLEKVVEAYDLPIDEATYEYLFEFYSNSGYPEELIEENLNAMTAEERMEAYFENFDPDEV